jgi:hypothetical protein
MAKQKKKTNGFSSPTDRTSPPKTGVRCPKCGKEVKSLHCGHCGSQISAEQSALLSCVKKKAAQVGGNRTDSTNKKGAGNGSDGNEQYGFEAPIRSSDSGKPEIGNPRRKNDAYYTPQLAIDALLTVEKFTGAIWEPAQGDGRIVRTLKRAGYDAFGTDLETGTDFLVTVKKAENIVTNPPFTLKTEFIRHSQECARRKIALLVPLSTLSGIKRSRLFQDRAFPLRTVYIFAKRLTFDPYGEAAAGWFIWERGFRGKPTLVWL